MTSVTTTIEFIEDVDNALSRYLANDAYARHTLETYVKERVQDARTCEIPEEIAHKVHTAFLARLNSVDATSPLPEYPIAQALAQDTLDRLRKRK